MQTTDAEEAARTYTASASSRIAAGVALMRPAQWIKNSFVLAPLFFSGHWDFSLALKSLAGAAAFCLLSSAVYILNDWCDLEDDKHHVTKRLRPLASGRISVPSALILGVGLFVASIAITGLAGLPWRIFLIYAAYAAINIGYSLGMKHVPVLELFMVASGFILRLIAGSIIVGETLSSWIIVCTGLVSLMLVVGKRRGDIANVLDETGRRRSLKHYTLSYLDQLMTILAAATFVTYLLFCISDYGMARFGTGVAVTAIFVLFGIFRFLQILAVQAGGDSPTDIVLGDTPLRTAILLWIVTFFVIIYVMR